MKHYSKNKLYKQGSRQITFQEILSRITNKTGCQPKQSGSNYIFKCLFHDDKHASLYVKQSEKR